MAVRTAHRDPRQVSATPGAPARVLLLEQLPGKIARPLRQLRLRCACTWLDVSDAWGRIRRIGRPGVKNLARHALARVQYAA